MNAVDALLVALVALGVLGGWARGFIRAVLGLLALLVGLLAAFAGWAPLATLLDRHVAPMGVWSAPLAFVGAYVLVRSVLALVVGGLLARVPPRAHLHAANRAAGTLPGAANGLLNAAIAAFALLALPLPASIHGAARDSALAPRLAAPADWLEAQLAPVFHPAVARTLQMLTVRPESRERVDLRFTVADARPRPDLERAMLELVNRERAAQGLRPLAADPELVAVARAHSHDMFARGYFSHVTPDGRDPFDRIRAASVRFRVAGENLALAPTLDIAHQGLMNSPGHRANILRPAFGRLGVGVLDGGRRGLMVTQAFRN